MDWWGVVNPAAGRRYDAMHKAQEALHAAGVEAELRESKSGAHVAGLVNEGINAGFTRFLAVGGDGTVNLVANGILASSWDQPPVLGVLPAGSGCDLIRSFDISQDMDEAAKHLAGDGTAPLDAVYLNGPWGERYFLNSAGSGLTGAGVEEVERMPAAWGAFRYQLAIWPALIKLPLARVEVVCGEHRFDGNALMLVISNARFLAGGMKMAPHADPGDGMLNVQVIHGPKRIAFILKPMVQRGKHLNHPNVELMSGPSVSVRTDPDWPIEADGEYLGRGSIEASVVPSALKLKV